MKKLLMVILLGALIAGPAISDVLVPSWGSDAETSSVLYKFTDDSTTPVADEESNPNGTGSALIDEGTGAAAGWVPAVPLFGARGDSGYWNINDDGYIQINVPVADGSLISYELELWIDAISFVDLTTLPDIEVNAPVVESNTYDEFLEAPTLGEWRHVMWTGIVSVASAADISIDILGTSGSSQIDRVAVYSRIIPEPAVITLILGSSTLLLVIRRRFM